MKEVVPISSKQELDLKKQQEEAEKAFNENRGDWYVVHTYSGYENKIKVDLTKRVESMNMQDKIFDVLIPEEQEVEFKGGKRKIVTKRIFPGYVIVNMKMDDESWNAVRHTPGVTGFVGSGTRPLPLQSFEVEKILKQMGLVKSKTKIIDVAIGENVRVRTGPFANFEGVVKELLSDRGKVRVNISMFGRETPVELEYEQIDKL